MAVIWPSKESAKIYLERPWCCSEIANAIYNETHQIYTASNHVGDYHVAPDDYSWSPEDGCYKNGPKNINLMYMRYAAFVGTICGYLGFFVTAIVLIWIVSEVQYTVEGHTVALNLYFDFKSILQSMVHGVMLFFVFSKVKFTAEFELGVWHTLSGHTLRNPVDVISFFEGRRREGVPKEKVMESLQKSGHLCGGIFDFGDAPSCGKQICEDRDMCYVAVFTLSQAVLKLRDKLIKNGYCEIITDFVKAV